MKIAEVAFPLPTDQVFDYEVPADGAQAAAGVRVKAPFGPRLRSDGIVLSVREGPASQPLKRIAAVLDPQPVLSEELVALSRWLSRRYCAPIGECVKILLPANLRKAKRAIRGDALPDGADRGARERRRSAPSAFKLTTGQDAALRALSSKLRSRRFSPNLLFGVPASGKTEVYIRLIRQAMEGGGQALFLVPEISLTRPFFEEFQAGVGQPVALWHSQLGAKARKETWMGLRSGRTRVVVGARSASLLPFRDLRLVVMDEEQDESYKQEGMVPYYHARDVALERARSFGAVMVLGSATPSIEACASAKAGDFELLKIDERVSKTTDRPPVSVIARPPREGRCLTDELVDGIRASLARKEQVILLVNRRGYSNFIICRKCSWVARCPGCSVAFIHHKASEGANIFGFHLRCHHCGGTSAVPPKCGRCGHAPMRFAGVGTQKVVSELRAWMPEARVLRMDRDTVSKEKPDEAGIYRRFKSRKADILVGTKLVAKGFHFPHVTLVGVVDADTMLNMPDFRSAERTVQLLVQAAGRAGRAERPGQVLLQTGEPAHYAIQAVARGDYAGFAGREISIRRDLGYPPASTLIRLMFTGKTEDTVRKGATAAARALKGEKRGRPLGDLPGLGLPERRDPAAPGPEGAPADEVLGPAPGIPPKVRERFRFHLLLKVKDPDRVDAVLEHVRNLKRPSTVKMKVNVDPYDFF